MKFIKALNKDYKIILGSSSPRRIHLLKSIGINFEVLSPDIDENIFQKNEPVLYCKKISLLKLFEIIKKIYFDEKDYDKFDCLEQFINESLENKNSEITLEHTLDKFLLKNKSSILIISADTIVFKNNKILNKPSDKNDAINILKSLSNSNHSVYTGVSIFNSSNKKIISNYSKTNVYFRKLDVDEIIDYVKTEKPMDKAGAYGLQDDYGSLFISKIEGCSNNVIGLPLELVFQMLKQITI